MQNTTYLSRLRNLSDEIGDSIIVIKDPERQVEEMITAVANREIDYTAAQYIGESYGKKFPDQKTLVEWKQLIDKYLKSFQPTDFKAIEEELGMISAFATKNEPTKPAKKNKKKKKK